MYTYLSKLRGFLDQLRLRLASPDALMLLSLLGVMTGLLTSLIVISFRYLLEVVQENLFLTGKIDHFESLPSVFHFCLLYTSPSPRD